ncbi:MAG: hypothetical protein V4507_01595 [Verrucomicrobiota bacterium]
MFSSVAPCLRGKILCLLFCLFLGGLISAFSSSLTDFDTRPEWDDLFGKDRLLAHLIETGDPQSHLLHRAWLENEVANQLRQPAIFSSIRKSLLQGDALLQETMEDSLLALNLPSDYARLHLMEWTLGSDPALRSHLLSFFSSATIRTRFATYLFQHHSTHNSVVLLIQQACETQNPYLERELRKRISMNESIDWTPLPHYPQLPLSAQLEFRWKLFRALPNKDSQELASPGKEKTTSFADLLWKQIFQKVEQTSALREEYISRIQQRTEPEQWTRQALTESLRQNEADDWFQSYLRAAQIPQSRYRAVFDSLIQNRSEKRIRPEQIAESSQERTAWRARLIQLIQDDPRWSFYFLWNLTRASEPVTLQFRRALPSLFAQHETLALEWHRWNGISSTPLSSPQLKAWGIQWGERLRDQDLEWSKLWVHHDLPTQALLQKTVAALLEENPVLVTTWVNIIDRHQAPLQNAFALWTRQNSPHPEMSNFPQFMNKLVGSIQRKEWVGNVDIAVFRAAFGNFLLSHEGWNQVRWRIGIESFEIAQPLRDLLAQHWSQHPENFWRILTWRTLFSPEPQSEQKIRAWIQTQKITEKTLLALSQQNPEIQTATQSFWVSLFESNPALQKALEQKSLHPTRQDDLDQILASLPSSQSSPSLSLSEILLHGGDAPLADWILRNSELQIAWREQFEEQLIQNPRLLKRIIESLVLEKSLPSSSFQELIQKTTEDRLLFETLISDPTLGFKNQIKTNPQL